MKKLIPALTLVVSLLTAQVHAASVKDLLSNAILPVGKCLYVYGGGWNMEDTGAGIEAMSYGLSPKWQEFYTENDSSYNHKNFSYKIHNGLDCTGYAGWCMYQIFGDAYSKNGYVYLAKDMAWEYAKIFNSAFTPKQNIVDYQSGDVMSSPQHAYIVLGGCEDKSVVILHASPPAVSICGTYTTSGNPNSQAVQLATHYMSSYFPEHYRRYPKCSRNTSYLTDYNQMRWNETVLSDSDGYRQMSAEEILKDLFQKVKIYHNNQRINFSLAPYIQDGVTYVPLREFAESLGAEVIWNNVDETAHVKYSGKIIEAYPDNISVMINDSIMIPIRNIADFLDLNVIWEEFSQSVYLTNR